MRRHLLGFLPLFAASSLAAATFTVTNTNDSGAGSLRQAILDANANTGADTIAFAVTGAGCSGTPVICSIQPTASYAVQDAVLIDGYTQPGSSPNTLAVGNDAVLLIEIDGSLSGGAEGLVVETGGADIRGLVFNRFLNTVLNIGNSGSIIQGNFIGTNPAGTIASANYGPGISLVGDNNLIGGPNPADRNVISASSGDGPTGANIVVWFGSGGAVIQGNYIGTNAAGTAALGGSYGVHAFLTTNVTIGGASPGEGNLISGMAQFGVFLDALCPSSFSTGNVIQGNLIGTDAAGTSAIPNGVGGIFVGQCVSDSLIGGTGVGEGNVIAYNGAADEAGAGIYSNTVFGTGNRIRGNSIFENTSTFGSAFNGQGIDLNPGGGYTANDPGDTDGVQNFPIVSTTTILGPQGAGTQIQGVLHSAASTTYDLDFYANPACTNFPRDLLEGQTYLGAGQVTTDGSGTGVFDITVPGVIESGQLVSATATNPDGSTSEFSQRLPYAIAPWSAPAGGGTLMTIFGTDFEANATVTIGGLAATDIVVTNFNQIRAMTPPLSPGTINDVVVANADGSAGTLKMAFVADFLDVPLFHQFHEFVTRLVSNGITVGQGSGLYGPNNPTLRQQMAVFLVRAKHGLCFVPPPCTTAMFTDVPCSSGFAPWINQLVTEGVTGGCGDGTTYCPTDPVKRQQMATLLLRTLEGTGYTPPACTAATFTDVPCSNPFAPWIYELVNRQITGGCGGGNYCPGDPASRGQMAVFVDKTFHLAD